MCPPKKQKIESADPVVASAPPLANPAAPVLNDANSAANADGRNSSLKRKGKKALVIGLANPALTSRPQIGVNVPR